MRVVLITLACLLARQLPAQSIHVGDQGRDFVVSGDQIYERFSSSERFILQTNYPRIPQSEHGDAELSCFDGRNVYRVAALYGKGLRLQEGTRKGDQMGWRWDWHPPIVLKGPHRFLSASRGWALVVQRGERAPSGKLEHRLLSVDLQSGDTKVIERFQDPNESLDFVAVAVDGIFTVFSNTGFIYRLDPNVEGFKELSSDFMSGLVPKWITKTVDAQGKSMSFPLRFLAPPFLGNGSYICVPMQVRQRATWPLEAVQAMYEALPPQEQERLVKEGIWPQTKAYEGSEDAFCLVKFDPLQGNLSVASPDSFGELVETRPHTGTPQLRHPTTSLNLTSVGERFVELRGVLDEGRGKAERIGTPRTDGRGP